MIGNIPYAFCFFVAIAGIAIIAFLVAALSLRLKYLLFISVLVIGATTAIGYYHEVTSMHLYHSSLTTIIVAILLLAPMCTLLMVLSFSLLIGAFVVRRTGSDISDYKALLWVFINTLIMVFIAAGAVSHRISPEFSKESYLQKMKISTRTPKEGSAAIIIYQPALWNGAEYNVQIHRQDNQKNWQHLVSLPAGSKFFYEIHPEEIKLQSSGKGLLTSKKELLLTVQPNTIMFIRAKKSLLSTPLVLNNEHGENEASKLRWVNANGHFVSQ